VRKKIYGVLRETGFTQLAVSAGAAAPGLKTIEFDPGSRSLLARIGFFSRGCGRVMPLPFTKPPKKFIGECVVSPCPNRKLEHRAFKLNHLNA